MNFKGETFEFGQTYDFSPHDELKTLDGIDWN